MKKASLFRIQFFARLSVITCLGLLGLLALTAEPDAHAPFLKTFIMQMGVCVGAWLSAWALFRYWRLGRIINRIKLLNN